jgi:SNF2 family DNA or RNA helicase
LDSFNGVQAAKPSRRFKGSLREYQQEGLGWLQFTRKFGFGACLADDMGLGKTVQVLALIDSMERKGPVLIVVPALLCSIGFRKPRVSLQS